MELSLYLARVWGLFAILTSIGLFINRKSYEEMVKQIKKDDISVLIAGVLAMSIGIAQVVAYNSWAFNYAGLITLFGWSSLIKGVAIVFVPGYMEKFVKVFLKESSWYTGSLVIFLIAGVYLLYASFTG